MLNKKINRNKNMQNKITTLTKECKSNIINIRGNKE